MPATSDKDDGASMAMAEQQRPLHVLATVFLRMLLLELERPWSLVTSNLWMCGLDSAIRAEKRREEGGGSGG